MVDKGNKGGRPRRAEGETLERLTINLRPSIKLGLELLARVRGGSLSQACEYALATTLRNEKFEGSSLFDISNEALRVVDDKGAMLVLNTDVRILAAFRLPQQLRTPEEQFVLQVYTAIRPKIKLEQMARMYELASSYFSLGLSEREAAKQISEDLASASATEVTTHAKKHDVKSR